MAEDIYRQIRDLRINTLDDLKQLAVDIMQEGADGGWYMFEHPKCHEMEKEEESLVECIASLEQRERR